MKKVIGISLVSCLFTIGTLQAQELGKVSYSRGHDFGLSLSAGVDQFAGALDWSHLHGFGKKNRRFKVGYGLRLTAYRGVDQEYITAPALLTSKQEGPQVLFSETYEENLDTLSFAQTQVNMLNVVIHLQYSILSQLDVGFNIDAVGFSFGAQQMGLFSSTLQQAPFPIQQKAKPTTYNLLLVSDNDIGSLNSELFVRYWVNKIWSIKAGATFLFTEYKTENELTFNNDRFRNKSLLLMLGTSFKPFN